MTKSDYQPKYKWRETWPGENGLDGKPLQDFQGWDGEISVGRIRLEEAGPKRGEWQWSGHGPMRVRRHLPHQGYSPTAREASRMAEAYYETLLTNSKLRGAE